MDKGTRVRIIISLIVLVLGIIALFFDQKTSSFFYKIHTPFLDYLLNLSVYFQIPGILFGLIILLFAILFFLRREKLKWILKIVSSFLITSGVTFILKEITNRPRPYVALGLEEPPLSLLGESFPSAHAAVVFTMLPFFEKEYPRLKYLWIMFAVLVCFIRVYFTVHYLSDILFGALIGYLIGYFICNFSLEKYFKK